MVGKFRKTDEGLCEVAFSGVPFGRQAETLYTKEPSFEVSRMLTVVVDEAGFEPATFGIGNRCANHLCHPSICRALGCLGNIHRLSDVPNQQTQTTL